ncbi:hypothetical protein [Streptomyces graminilatus]|uniref:hypothetical protein n=1 Tax=Streptomyces graminilatus TaxID=1464070 RepID=UPI00099F172A|nr:hypothetical protein [Streptomyces graminilatus]
MSADREKNQDMAQVAHGDGAHSDITFLLAGAADGVEIGIAPYQAVVRGGRRRRARRWAVASAAALVIAGSTGTLALAGIGDGKAGGTTQTAIRPPTAEERNVYAPLRTTLAMGEDRGKEWWVTVDIWGAPKNEVEAARQFQAMTERGQSPADARIPKDLVGRGSFFVDRGYGDTETTPVMLGGIDKTDVMSGTDLDSAALPLEPNASDGALKRLVIGQVAPTARTVTCTWNDGTTTVAHKVPANYAVNAEEALIRPVEGSQAAWFVCLAGEGKGFKSVKVTG